MALKEVRTCDVFDTKAEATPVNVQMTGPNLCAEEFGPVDMSKRARDRLRKFIERGMSPPKKAE